MNHLVILPDEKTEESKYLEIVKTKLISTPLLSPHKKGKINGKQKKLKKKNVFFIRAYYIFS